MAKLSVCVVTGHRPLKGAQVRIYAEKLAVAEGNEANSFTDDDLLTVYSDPQMTQEITQPVTTDDLGEAIVYAPSGSQVAMKISRDQYGERWHRFVDVVGSDI